jgi:hypothetical protein
VKHRPLAVVAAAAVAAAVLAGCDSKVGAAASVGSQTIRESQIAPYLTDRAKPIPTQGGGTVVPRSYVLQDFVLESLLTSALAAHGGVPSTAQIARAATQLKQGRSTAEIVAGYTRYGFTAKMAAFDYRVHALESLLGSRTRAQNIQALARTVNAQHVPVSVSRRFGSWDPSTLSIATSSRDGLPGMVSLQPSPALQAQP